MVPLDGDELEIGSRVTIPMVHIATVDCAVQHPIKGDYRDSSQWGHVPVLVLYRHDDVIHAHGSHAVEQPVVPLHLFKSREVALLKNL